MWVASQADRVTANRTALVGSIGAYTVLVDSSEAEGAKGRKVHVVKFGQDKGAGIAGAPVTEPQLAEFQRLIDARGQQFIDAIVEGRGLERAKVVELADGRVHTAADALVAGLIDAVADASETLKELQEHVNQSAGSGGQPNRRKATMAQAAPANENVVDPLPSPPRWSSLARTSRRVERLPARPAGR